jgi:hypothetical protein
MRKPFSNEEATDINEYRIEEGLCPHYGEEMERVPQKRQTKRSYRNPQSGCVKDN